MSDTQFKPVAVPAPNFLLGHLLRLKEGAIQFSLDMAQHGDWTTFRVANARWHLINHPDLIQYFLVKKFEHFDTPPRLKRAVASNDKYALFIADGRHWERQHQLMIPAFHATRISHYADTMVDITLQRMMNWETGTQVDIDHEMMRLTMQVITSTMFNLDLDDDLMSIGDLVEDVFAIFHDRIVSPIILPYWVPTKQNRELSRIRQKLFQLIDVAIDKWRETEEDRGDLLSMLMVSTYEDGSKMDDEMLKLELLGIFAMGHETTAHTLAFTFYLLASQPAIKARLQQEIDTQLQGRRPTFENIRRLTYLDMVLNETMRIYPVSQLIWRSANQDTEIYGTPVRKSETVAISTWALHHDERWFPDSWTFDPERFTSENETLIPKYAYLPFGAGPRVCIGKHFALLEARLVLVTLMQRFDFELADDYTLTPEAVITVRPAEGVPLTMTVRDAVKQTH